MKIVFKKKKPEEKLLLEQTSGETYTGLEKCFFSYDFLTFSCCGYAQIFTKKKSENRIRKMKYWVIQWER